MDSPCLRVVLDGRTLDGRALVSVARFNAPVQLSTNSRATLEATRQYIDRHWLTDDAPLMYAFNTGVGALKNVRIGADQVVEFQTNLIRASSAGTGEQVPAEVVRAMMVLRVNAFASNYSGVRPEIVDRLVAMLNHGIVPQVAAQGSVGASGDLAPLAMMAGAMMGLAESKVDYRGRVMPAAEAFVAAGMTPTIEVRAKDATALINGTTASLAYAALAAHDARSLLDEATVSLCLSLEALRCELSCFEDRVMLARPHLGQSTVAASMRSVLSGTRRCTEAARQVRLRSAPENDIKLSGALHSPALAPRIQDAYSLRCAPQVHGPVLDALDYIDKLLTTEMNSATDNPLIFKEGKDYQVVSGGHFHGQYIAQAMDLLALVVTDLSAICDRRSARLVDPACSFDLPAGLIAERAGVNTGLSGVQSMGTALVLENMGLCSPASAMSLPAKGNTEDHISNSCVAARRTRAVIRNAQTVVAVEMLLATQALDLAERDLAAFPVGVGTKAAWEAVRAHLPASFGSDRWVFNDVEMLKSLVIGGQISRAVDAVIARHYSKTACS